MAEKFLGKFLAKGIGKRQLIGVALAAVLVMAVSAPTFGAHNGDANQHQTGVLRGGGSDTSYNMMTALDALYNGSVGCKTIKAAPNTSSTTLDQTCQEPNNDPASPLYDKTRANYDHDVFVEYMPTGSSLGIKQLQNQGLAGVFTSNFARSSRAPKSGDSQNLRFVAYARDALTWVCFKGRPNAACNSMPDNPAGSGRPNLTQAQLQGIYNCTITDWGQVGGTAGVTIKPYQAQVGSGTGPTWDGFLGYTGTNRPLESCAPSIFENDAALIPEADRDAAIYYYSYGRHGQQTPAGKGTTMGNIDGIVANDTTVGDETFPFGRFIFNVLRNSYPATTPPAAPANNASPDVRQYLDVTGFLCKSKTSHEENPLTLKNYRDDIVKIITDQGFVAIPGGPTWKGPAPIPAGLNFASFCRVVPIPS